VIHAAIDSWTKQLVDLGGRNNLLFYRDQRSGTIDLSMLSGLDQETLLSGATIDPMGPFTPDQRSDALRRLRRIYSKAREQLEEQGLATLFIGLGLATWTSDRTPNAPNAPILLRRATLVTRGAAQAEFRLTLADEMEVNPTLLHVLEAEFGRPIDIESLPPRIDGAIDTSPEVSAVFSWLSEVASHVPGFAVKPALLLANFSYAKLPMVKDLEAAAGAMARHDIVAALAGDKGAIAAVRKADAAVVVDPCEPDHVVPGREFLVVDADASQSYVINSVLAGRNLIVKGPPGTGKSQTIANLIAAATAGGKTVLFVAEKRAAIEAVLKRLDACGLGDLVLDMHGAVTRREIAQTLARSLRLAGTVPAVRPDPTLESLLADRARLASHVAAIHKPREPWGVSVYDARLVCHASPPEARTSLRLPSIPKAKAGAPKVLDAEAYKAVRREMETLAELDPFEPQTMDSPWQRLTRPTPERIRVALEAAGRVTQDALATVGEVVQAAAAQVGLPETGSVRGLTTYVSAWRNAELATTVFGPGVFGPETGTVAGVALDGGPKPIASTDNSKSTLIDEWEARFPSLFPEGDSTASSNHADANDLYAFLRPRSRFGRIRAGLADPTYQQARERVRALLLDPATSEETTSIAMTGAIQATRTWQEAGGTGVPRPPAVPIKTISESLDGFAADLSALEACFAGSKAGSHNPSVSLADLPIPELRSFLVALVEDRPMLLKMTAIADRMASLRASGLAPLLDEMRSERLSGQHLVARFDFVWHRSILDTVEASDVGVATFNANTQDGAVDDFGRMDSEVIAGNPARIQRAYAERTISALETLRDEGNLVVHQASLKRGHMPLRRLFAAAPNMLLRLKPCWAMSPLTVSQWLPSDRPYFDIVVFDEASQVLPADAVPAILRGRQLVVAGDDRQLPPTTFFASQSLSGDGDEESMLADLVATSGFESVLDAVTPILPTAMLRWHYRSFDESLIEFSNEHFYDGSLTTFPSASAHAAVRHVLVPFKARAGSVAIQEVSSADEVAEVVRLVIEHAEQRPTESLGVIALGITHAERLSDALRAALHDRHDLDAFFDDSAPEAFFIKNLERVQGDEREAIILSIGYGKSADGRLMYRFGPLNVEGGERRLNVAITRARRRMTVVSSFSASDMDPKRTSSKGAALLRDYLTYADLAAGCVGRSTAAEAAGAPSFFEADVVAGLADIGITVVPRLGASGRTIDFAARHPLDPSRYVLALETDGSSYAAAATTRDRDRLRREQLARLGWAFRRLWTEHWISDRPAALKLIKASFDAAVAASDAPPKAPKDLSRPKVIQPPSSTAPEGVAAAPAGEATTAVPRSRGPRPSFPDRPKINPNTRSFKPEELAALVDWIESDGVDRPESEVMALLLAEIGVKNHLAATIEVVSRAVFDSRTRRFGGRYKAYPRPVVPASWTLSDAVTLAAWIESDTLLRTEEQLESELMRELGVKRHSYKVMAAARRARASRRVNRAASTSDR